MTSPTTASSAASGASGGWGERGGIGPFLAPHDWWLSGAAMKIISHFKHNVFMIDEAGDVVEHLGATED